MLLLLLPLKSFSDYNRARTKVKVNSSLLASSVRPQDIPLTPERNAWGLKGVRGQRERPGTHGQLLLVKVCPILLTQSPKLR